MGKKPKYETEIEGSFEYDDKDKRQIENCEKTGNIRFKKILFILDFYKDTIDGVLAKKDISYRERFTHPWKEDISEQERNDDISKEIHLKIKENNDVSKEILNKKKIKTTLKKKFGLKLKDLQHIFSIKFRRIIFQGKIKNTQYEIHIDSHKHGEKYEIELPGFKNQKKGAKQIEKIRKQLGLKAPKPKTGKRKLHMKDQNPDFYSQIYS